VEDSAEAIMSVNARVSEPIRVGYGFGQGCLWSNVRDALVRPVRAVEGLELA
jgi:hypothetical protein